MQCELFSSRSILDNGIKGMMFDGVQLSGEGGVNGGVLCVVVV